MINSIDLLYQRTYFCLIFYLESLDKAPNNQDVLIFLQSKEEILLNKNNNKKLLNSNICSMYLTCLCLLWKHLQGKKASDFFCIKRYDSSWWWFFFLFCFLFICYIWIISNLQLVFYSNSQITSGFSLTYLAVT